jgi:2,3-bisphosphoglycerate-dependent phosphoglycerate mutase
MNLLVVSHGNAIRSLVMHLEKMDSASVERLEIPSGIPLLCRFKENLEMAEKEWLE